MSKKPQIRNVTVIEWNSLQRSLRSLLKTQDRQIRQLLVQETAMRAIMLALVSSKAEEGEVEKGSPTAPN